MNTFSKQALRALVVVAVIGGAAAFLWVGKARPVRLVALPTVARHDLVMQERMREGRREVRWFRVAETNAFTGLMVDSYPNGALMTHSMISNGLANGWTETWYTNGQMQMREGFSNGVSQGLREKWHPNGRKMSEAVIVDGKVTGVFQSWHENGRLSERIEMKQGQPDGIAWAYYPSGFAKAEIAERDGKELTRKSWKDGEYKTTQ
jgi:antitoxin component YwqK of YwqJK toxin-antitoxin module